MSSPTIVFDPRISGLVTSATDLGQLQHLVNWPPAAPLARFEAGITSGLVDSWFSDTRSLASNTSESLDLNGTTLLDPFGTALTLLHVNLIAIKAAAGNSTALTIGNVTNGFVGPNGAAGTTILTAGQGAVFWDPGAGWAVTAATADLLKIANAAGATASFDLLILGRSA